MILFLLIAGFSPIYADRCASVPSSLWCSSETLSKECGFKEFCDRYRNATYNQRINMTILTEAHCIDCQNFIVDVLYPKVYKNFGKFINIEFVPYGNVKMVNGSIQCQHGPEECAINKFESCLIDSVKTQEKYVPLMACIESNLRARTPFDKVFKKCLRKYSVSRDTKEKIKSCFTSGLGEQLQLKAAEITAHVWPDKHNQVPWIVINGVSLGKEQSMMDHLPYLLCEWYTGDEKIPYCLPKE